ncbi:hypothetical protein Mmc1_2605 [Magnetococcus marinus MC-1]|uniref:Uncharacterized protein n=1 Tax=Magnetococcus marinus (strain ATCC BAA-1437 / JCM 17883 / MC-1) TaxID=156889 RepID=A0LAV8_MAGMM|nr:DUF6511 domain-containing protein [Magnetococcus marinus]ABK45101.1 hypothetical protein Mmc1_2605 [Magnetococcus marinus MC-1]
MAMAWTRRPSTWHDPAWGWVSLPPGLKTRRIGLGALQRKEKQLFQRHLENHPQHVLIWLLGKVRAVPVDLLLEVRNMVDATKLEKAAMAATLPLLGEYVASVDMQRPLASYSKEEVLTMVEVVITAYQEYMAKATPDTLLDDIPF